MLIRLPKIDPARLEELLEEAWRIAAPKRLRAAASMDFERDLISHE